MNSLEIRKLTEMGIALALAVVLNYLKLFEMPQGGSVSLEMIPILFIALRWEWREGVLLGAGYGILQAVLGGYFIHWIQLIMDYPLAYGVLGLAGVVSFKKVNNFKKQSILITGAVLFGSSLRFITHFISGMVFFGHYAPEGQPVWIYSVVYNASYLIPEMIITIIIMLILVKTIINNHKFDLKEE